MATMRAQVIEGVGSIDGDEDSTHPPTPWSRAALLQASALLTTLQMAVTEREVGGLAQGPA